MKLIKTEDEQGVMYSLSGDNLPENYVLSKENCDELFGIVDVEKLVDEEYSHHFFEGRIGFRDGFNKAMELNKDKLFTLEELRYAFYTGMKHGSEGGIMFGKALADEYVQSLQQPTEIDVEIVMEEKLLGLSLIKPIPKLDSSGNLILKKI